MCFAGKAGESEMYVGGVGADAKFLFEGIDDERVPFLYGGAGEIGNEEVKISEATREKVGGDYTLRVTQWGATYAFAYLLNFLVHEGLLGLPVQVQGEVDTKVSDWGGGGDLLGVFRSVGCRVVYRDGKVGVRVGGGVV